MESFRYVRACEWGDWHLVVKRKDDPRKEEFTVPFRCKSWRHAGQCCWWKGSQDFARVKEALEGQACRVYATFTFDPKDWSNWRDEYLESSRLWSLFHRRAVRKYGEIPYVQTWERHKAAGIHCNSVMINRGLWDECGESKRRWKVNWLEPTLRECGFGPVSWIVRMREGTESGMAGYLVKLARELVGAVAKNQIPFDAPKHFRRLRASRGLLPPVVKNPDWTGYMQFVSAVNGDGEVICSPSIIVPTVADSALQSVARVYPDLASLVAD